MKNIFVVGGGDECSGRLTYLKQRRSFAGGDNYQTEAGAVER